MCGPDERASGPGWCSYCHTTGIYHFPSCPLVKKTDKKAEETESLKKHLNDIEVLNQHAS